MGARLVKENNASPYIEDGVFYIPSDVVLSLTGKLYWGDPNTDGSVRMYVSGGTLVTELRVGGSWV